MSIISLEALTDVRAAGGKIVLTNGCFDILHRGHVAYLQDARALGDVLVVAVNLDDSVGRLKPGRPYNTLADRMFVLAGLSCVDYVVPFAAGEDTADHLLRALKPDVYVKGGDYTPETLPEAEVVQDVDSELVIVREESGYSTTALIEKIRSFTD